MSCIERLEKDFEAIISGDQPIILYGARLAGAIVCSILRCFGKEPACFCDADAKKHGTQYQGVSVISPKEAAALYPPPLIVW